MNKKLLEILDGDERISEVDLEMLEQYAKRWKCSVFEAALDCHFLTETELADLLARSYQIDRVYNLTLKNSKSHALNTLKYHDAKRLRCFPLTYLDSDKKKLEVVLADPSRGDVLDEIKKKVGCEVILAVAERRHVLAAIDEKYPLKDQIEY